jgi:N5-(carboxyethyl)ornithine synthase
MVSSVGFPGSVKENERRRLTPDLLIDLVRADVACLAEAGYGAPLGVTDRQLEGMGVRVVSRSEALQADVILDPKAGDSEYLDSLSAHQIVFGWMHAVRNRAISDALLSSGVTAIAWEDMFLDGRHVFWENNVIAGEAAIMHVCLLRGTNLRGCQAAVLGRGNVALGAAGALHRLGASVEVFGREQERYVRGHLCDFDLLVNAVLWDVDRADHIVRRADLCSLRPGAWIVDISCDTAGAIESSVPTTIAVPTYETDGVVHYVVDHTPSLLHVDASRAITAAVRPYVFALTRETWDKDGVLAAAICVRDHEVVDARIVAFQGR